DDLADMQVIVNNEDAVRQAILSGGSRSTSTLVLLLQILLRPTLRVHACQGAASCRNLSTRVSREERSVQSLRVSCRERCLQEFRYFLQILCSRDYLPADRAPAHYEADCRNSLGAVGR